MFCSLVSSLEQQSLESLPARCCYCSADPGRFPPILARMVIFTSCSPPLLRKTCSSIQGNKTFAVFVWSGTHEAATLLMLHVYPCAAVSGWPVPHGAESTPPPPHPSRSPALSHAAPPRPRPQESSKKEVLRVCSQMDELMEEAKEDAANGNQGPSRRR